MSDDVGTAIQKGWYTLFTTDAGVLAAGSPPLAEGKRIYQPVKKDPVFPYIVLGERQILGNDDDCATRSEIFDRIHVWSSAVGYLECQAICDAVRAAVRRSPLDLSIAGFDVVLTQYVQTHIMNDPDPLTSHGVVEFRSLVDHA